MKVAAIQFAPVFRDVQGNINALTALVQEAVSKGARLIVLPELCTTGYSFMSKTDAKPHAEQISDWVRAGSPASMQAFGGIVKQFQHTGVSIAWGVMEQDFGTGDLYNSQVLIMPNLKFVTYRKINRWANDYLWAKAGTGSPPVVEVHGRKVGLLICRDVRDKSPEFEDFYEPGDANIVAFSTNWGNGGFPASRWVDFATSNKTWLVVANRYGKEINNDFGEGGTCIVSPEGEVFCEGLKWGEPCIVYAEVP